MSSEIIVVIVLVAISIIAFAWLEIHSRKSRRGAEQARPDETGSRDHAVSGE